MSDAISVGALPEHWRKRADEHEQRMRESSAAKFEPGVDIGRAKMLAFRDCAEELETALQVGAEARTGGGWQAETADVDRWRTFYRALAWMLNDYIGVTDSIDYREVDKRLGYAHEGYHNARRVMREHKPPLPERLQRFNDGTGCLYGGNSHPDRCVCQEKEAGQFAGTPHKHYDEPPYNCARCHCKAYEPAVALPSAPTEQP